MHLSFVSVLAMFFSLVSAHQTSHGRVLDISGGSYCVAMATKPLKDINRLDPYAPDRRYRSVMVSVFTPVIKSSHRCHLETVPYMTPLLAGQYDQMASSVGLANNTISTLQLQTCRVSSSTPHRGWHTRKTGTQKLPTILFSPGLGNSRLLYGAIARTISSFGYTVVTVDHPYDASVVEFPSGEVIWAADIDDSDPKALEKATTVRAQDLQFVTSELRNPNTLEYVAGEFGDQIATDHLIVSGHSLGGAAAAAVLASPNPLFSGGIDFDGQIVYPYNGIHGKPFILVGRPGHAQEDPSWDTFWSHNSGPLWALGVQGAAHGSFTDLPLILASLNLQLDESQNGALEIILGDFDWSKVGLLMAGVVEALQSYMECSGCAQILLKETWRCLGLKVVRAML